VYGFGGMKGGMGLMNEVYRAVVWLVGCTERGVFCVL
jgi:hypothetical protein